MKKTTLLIAFALMLSVTGCPQVGGPGTATARIDGVELQGPTGALKGIRIAFDRALDPESAEDEANYQVAGPGGTEVSLWRAHYFAGSHSVYISFADSIDLGESFESVNIYCGDNGGLRDALGRLVDGDGNGVPGGDFHEDYEFIELTSGETHVLTDFDGDEVELRVENAGGLDLILGKEHLQHQIWIVDAIPNQTRVSGALLKRSTGDGKFLIQSIVGLDKSEAVSISSDPVFDFRSASF